LDVVALSEGNEVLVVKRSSTTEDLGIPSNLGVPHSHFAFGGLNRPSGASSTSGMDGQFPWNASEGSVSG